MIEYVKPFVVMEMPLDKNGNGPVTDGTHAYLTWQIWDQLCQTFGNFLYEENAQIVCDALNMLPEQV